MLRWFVYRARKEEQGSPAYICSTGGSLAAGKKGRDPCKCTVEVVGPQHRKGRAVIHGILMQRWRLENILNSEDGGVE
jgi:hypothetical protein